MASLLLSRGLRRLPGTPLRTLGSSFAAHSTCGDTSGLQEKLSEYVRERLGHTDPKLTDLLEKNKQWIKEKNEEDPTYFPRSAVGQEPYYLYIGCSDARVDPMTMTGLRNGEMFVHRNVGNVVSGTDLNLMSVLEFSIGHLKIPHIIVCGHYECGAVKGASSDADLGTLENWLRNIRDVRRLHHDELSQIKDPKAYHRRLVELNVVEQAMNVLKTGVVQRERAQSLERPGADVAVPLVHAMVFDPANGELRKLDVDLEKQIEGFDEVYSMYEPDIVS